MKHPIQYSICSIAIILFCIVTLAFILPLGQAISPLFGSMTSVANASYQHTSGYTPSAIAHIIAYTLKESILSVVIALIVGIPAAYFVSHKKIWICGILSSLAAVPLCIPPLIIALGYIATFGMAGSVNKLIMTVFHLQAPPITFLYSFWGIVITQGFYNFPIIMKTVADSWECLDTNQAEAAALLGASRWRIFRTITVFQLFPSIASASIPVFMYSFFSFMIVLMFGTIGGTTLEVAIYHAGRSILNFHSVAVLASIETATALSILVAYSLLEQKTLHRHGISFIQASRSKTKVTKKELISAIIFFSVIAVFFLVPLLSIAISSFSTTGAKRLAFTLSRWKKICTAKSFYAAVKNTFVTATCSSILSTVTGLVYALFLRVKNNTRKHPVMNSMLCTVPLLPMAVSSVVMGIGMTLFIKRGNPVHLILMQSALAAPFAFRQLYAPLNAIPQDTIDAARMLSKRGTDIIFSILIPYCKTNIISALGFCFAISAGDATLPLVLAIHKFDTLSLYTYRLAGSYRFPEACACGLLLGALCMTVFSLSRKKNPSKERYQ